MCILSSDELEVYAAIIESPNSSYSYGESNTIIDSSIKTFHDRNQSEPNKTSLKMNFKPNKHELKTVSYTHLTLPTILLV